MTTVLKRNSQTFLYSGFEDITAMDFLGNNAEIGKGVKIHTVQISLVHAVPPVSFQPSAVWEQFFYRKSDSSLTCDIQFHFPMRNLISKMRSLVHLHVLES